MDVTVILCTFNRSQSLTKALRSVATQELTSTIEWEVLVVDNNSRDETRAVATEFCQRYPGRFRYLFEPRPGKSHALNTAIREAKGNILAFMDDDVVVDSAWLRQLTTALFNGDWAGAGGKILPDWTSPPPGWLPHGQYALAPLAAFDLGTEAGPMLEPPFGTNMAFRRSMFEKHGTFRTDLGPRPGSEIRNEDTEFGARLLAAGERLRYEPSAIVHHAVPAQRLQKEYFLKWWFDKARADIRQHGIPPETRWYFAGIPFYLFRRLTVWTVRWLITWQPSQRFSCKLNVWSKVGEMVECYRQSQARKIPVRTQLT